MANKNIRYQRSGTFRPVGLAGGAMALLLVLTRCGAPNSHGLWSSDSAPAEEPATAGVTTFELSSQLPGCNRYTSGQVYYVKSGKQFYYCDGRRYRKIDLDDPNWLTQVSAAPEAACDFGGALLEAGPDLDGNGHLLGAQEVLSSQVVCSGAPSCSVESGDAGTHTLTCPDGTSATIEDGEDGQDGKDGKDGTSCTVSEFIAGKHLIECGETQVIVSDGADGNDGADGADGADGNDGQSCTIEASDAGSGTNIITCSGVSVTVADGSDGDSCTVTDGIVPGEHIVTCGSTQVVLRNGKDGASCSVASNGDGSFSFTCSAPTP